MNFEQRSRLKERAHESISVPEVSTAITAGKESIRKRSKAHADEHKTPSTVDEFMDLLRCHIKDPSEILKFNIILGDFCIDDTVDVEELEKWQLESEKEIEEEKNITFITLTVKYYSLPMYICTTSLYYNLYFLIK